MSPEIVTVLGGGWSALEIDRDRLPGFVIGINDAALLARCDVGVSMDRLWTENRWSRLVERGIPFHIRSSAAKNVPSHDLVHQFDCDYTTSKFSDEAGILNGTNSGGCGFNLAYQMRPKLIYLVGFDMGRGPNGEVYWYKNYEWADPRGGTGNGAYLKWSRQFDVPAAQCRKASIDVILVTSLGRAAAVKDFETMAPGDLMKRAA